MIPSRASERHYAPRPMLCQARATTYCGAALGQSQDIANSAKNRSAPGVTANRALRLLVNGGTCSGPRATARPYRRWRNHESKTAWQELRDRLAGEEFDNYLPSALAGLRGRVCLPDGSVGEERSNRCCLVLSKRSATPRPLGGALTASTFACLDARDYPVAVARDIDALRLCSFAIASAVLQRSSRPCRPGSVRREGCDQ